MTGPLQSMTGFGQAEGERGDFGWRWEIRSVNGKGLDLKFRLPAGTEAVETACRDAARSLHRGTVNANLRIDRKAELGSFTIDDEALAAAARALRHVGTALDCDRPRPEAVLAMKGVLASPQPETGLTEEQAGAVTDGFREALELLLAARRVEGDRIAEVLVARCEDMAARLVRLREKTTDTREQIAERLRGQLSGLLAQHVTEERLAQEAAMLAIRADVSEELDRLEVHTASFRDLLEKGGPVGRRLEFLTQELMREASTLTAKLHSAELKNEGLDLKELVDSLREQVLNIA